MNRKWCFVLGANVIAPLLNIPPYETWKDKTNKDQLKIAKDKCARILRRFKEEYGAPGISVGVSVDGIPVWKYGIGYSDVENLVSCTHDTNMRIASISKAITMTLIAKLAQEGKLDLDAPVQKYVPQFPEKKFGGEPVQITTRQLISHTSGIRHYNKKLPGPPVPQKEEEESEEEKTPIPEQPEPARHEFSLPEYYNHKHYNNVTDSLKMFQDDDLHYKPGTQYLYSSHGWTLASAVAEGAGNAPFLDQLNHLLRAMAMHETWPDLNNSLISERTSYYCRSSIPKTKHRLLNVRSVNNSYKWAAGGLVSTVSDLLIFGNCMLYCMQAPLHSEGYLSQSTMKTLWSPVIDMHSNLYKHPSKYGQGWMLEPGMAPATPVTNWTKSDYVCHSGGAIGATSILLIVPRDQLDNEIASTPSGICVAILINLQEAGDIYKLATQIANEFDLCVKAA